MDLSGGRQIPHGGFERLVAHPMLDCAWIESRPEHARGVCRSECLQVEAVGVDLGTGGYGFALLDIRHALFA